MSPRQTKPNLRRLREAQGLTREQLAVQISAARRGEHLNVRTLDRWESGESAIPESHWAELCELFGVSTAHLLGLDNGEPNGDGLRSAA